MNCAVFVYLCENPSVGSVSHCSGLSPHLLLPLYLTDDNSVSCFPFKSNFESVNMCSPHHNPGMLSVCPIEPPFYCGPTNQVKAPFAAVDTPYRGPVTFVGEQLGLTISAARLRYGAEWTNGDLNRNVPSELSAVWPSAFLDHARSFGLNILRMTLLPCIN